MPNPSADRKSGPHLSLAALNAAVQPLNTITQPRELLAVHPSATDVQNKLPAASRNADADLIAGVNKAQRGIHHEVHGKLHRLRKPPLHNIQINHPSRPPRQVVQRAVQPPLREHRRIDVPREVAQVIQASSQLGRSFLDELSGPLLPRLQTAKRQPERRGGRNQPLLRSVVERAFEALALSVARDQHPASQISHTGDASPRTGARPYGYP